MLYYLLSYNLMVIAMLYLRGPPLVLVVLLVLLVLYLLYLLFEML